MRYDSPEIDNVVRKTLSIKGENENAQPKEIQTK